MGRGLEERGAVALDDETGMEMSGGGCVGVGV